MSRFKKQLSAISVLVIAAIASFALFAFVTARANPLDGLGKRVPARDEPQIPEFVPADFPDVQLPVGRGINSPEWLPHQSVSGASELFQQHNRQPGSVLAPERDHCGMLDQRREFALGMIETGNNDRMIGQLGEVSRYQIMPRVWKHYSDSRDYRDQQAALQVAREHWTWLYTYFRARARREPTDFDMYVLWNTRYGYYAAKGFNPARLHPVVKDRAQRFANLVEHAES